MTGVRMEVQDDTGRGLIDPLLVPTGRGEIGHRDAPGDRRRAARPHRPRSRRAVRAQPRRPQRRDVGPRQRRHPGTRARRVEVRRRATPTAPSTPTTHRSPGSITAASVAVLGRSEVGVRVPGLLTALASIPLLWLLLTRLRLSPHAAAVGCAVALATPMFLGYGPMVDTPTMSFPIALALLAVWLAPRARPWLLASLAAAAVLAGWESCLLAAVVLAVELVRSRSGSRLLSRSLAAGFAVGFVSLSAWLLWVHGSLGPIIDTLTFRAGQDDPVRLSASLWAQADHLRSGFPLPVFAVAAAGCVLAVRRGGPLRMVTLVSGGRRGGLLTRPPPGRLQPRVLELLGAAPGGHRHRDPGAGRHDGPGRPAEGRASPPATRAPRWRSWPWPSRSRRRRSRRQRPRPSTTPPPPCDEPTLPPRQNRMWVRGDVVMPASWVEFYARRPVRAAHQRSLARPPGARPPHPPRLRARRIGLPARAGETAPSGRGPRVAAGDGPGEHAERRPEGALGDDREDLGVAARSGRCSTSRSTR